jgi:hypothetical protein
MIAYDGRGRSRAVETSVFRGLVAQRLVALYAGGWVLLNFPLLALWNRELSVLGLPLFPLALFAGWALLIALLAWVVESDRSERGERDPGR